MPTGWEPSSGEFPVAPRNVEVVTPYLPGKLDIRWDDPALLPGNSKFTVLGVNIYRAYNERGPYTRVNVYPIGGVIWRDFTDNVLVQNEIIHWDSGWQSRGDSPVITQPGDPDADIPSDPPGDNRNGRWTLRTEFPINKQFGQGISANAPIDVSVTVNGQRAFVHEVQGQARLITLVNVPLFDPVTEENVGPIVPTGPDDEVLVCYFTNKTLLRTDLDAKPVYRVTTVAADPSTASGVIETPLNFTEPVPFRDVERIDWIWRDAVCRNNWILQQGGERVKLFVKKVTGRPCPCYQDPRKREMYKQPRAMCTVCYGTGFVGGYDGPFDIMISPDEAERRVSQQDRGRSLEHTYEVWTGPSPMLTHRDFIVKQSNERYALGAIRNIAARGKILQQHFPISYLDESNIVYKVPVISTVDLPWPQTRGAAPILQGGGWPVPPNPPGPYPVGPDSVHPMQTEKSNIPDEREQRGRTRVWVNLTY